MRRKLGSMGRGKRVLRSPMGELSRRKPWLRGPRRERYYTMIPKNRNMLPRARELRRNMTPQERKLWYMFLRKYPVKFYKQRIIDSFIADFYCHAAKLVIEIDGSQHYTEDGEAYDAERSAVLESYGLMVPRFSNREIDTQFSSVCEKIDQSVKNRMK